jgi:nitrate/nitrite transport system substrate-binding protein
MPGSHSTPRSLRAPLGARLNRGTFLRGALAAAPAAYLAACGGAAPEAPKAGGPDVSSKPKITLGFIALTDNASVVMAHELGLFAKHGVNVEVTKEASWASVRDKLLSGELQGAHCLFGMPFSVYTGVGGPAGKELPIGMVLNANGQAITLSSDFCGVGYGTTAGVAPTVKSLQAKKEVTFAMTFPGGTHDMWLRYWLAASGVDQKSVKVITIPPAQMVANMKVKNMDGYCVGEPWGGVAVKEDIGFTHITTQDIWKHHPEKALVFNKEFLDTRRDDAKGVMRAILEASAWLDTLENRQKAASTIGGPSYVNAPPDIIDARLAGTYALGCKLGDKTFGDDTMLYHDGGKLNFPRKSHGAWFLAQYVRFGYLDKAPDYAAITDKLIKQDLYAEVAREMKVAVPSDDMQPFTVKLDGVPFDPKSPDASLKLYRPV